MQQVVKYEYDSLGLLISVKDANGNIITDQNNIGNKNPYRYRGYRYDTETGMYYLQSRYYNPDWARFLNADDPYILGEDQHHLVEHNLYAYGLNNQINMEDEDGFRAVRTLNRPIVRPGVNRYSSTQSIRELVAPPPKPIKVRGQIIRPTQTLPKNAIISRQSKSPLKTYRSISEAPGYNWKFQKVQNGLRKVPGSSGQIYGFKVVWEKWSNL